MDVYDFALGIFETIRFTDDLWEHGYSVEDATADLELFRQQDGWEIPDDITPENFSAAMNKIIADLKGTE